LTLHYDHKDIVELLTTTRANAYPKDGANRTSLWYAQDESHASIVGLLRKHRSKE